MAVPDVTLHDSCRTAHTRIRGKNPPKSRRSYQRLRHCGNGVSVWSHRL